MLNAYVVLPIAAAEGANSFSKRSSGVGEETGKRGMRGGGAEGSKRVWMRGRWKG